MEVKINKEIREFTEQIIFGLTLRQVIFSILSCIIGAFIYLKLKVVTGTEIASWVCIISVIPFVVLGFVSYNGMKAEKFLWCFIKSELLIPKYLVSKSQNFYYEILKKKK